MENVNPVADAVPYYVAASFPWTALVEGGRVVSLWQGLSLARTTEIDISVVVAVIQMRDDE